MNFDLSDEQQEIQRSVRDLCAARFTPARVREHALAGGVDDAAWTELCRLGWAGIAIPEEHGGQGLGMVELCVVAEELGAALAPVPFLGCAAAALVVSHAGDASERSAVLPGIAAGEVRASVEASEGALVPDTAGVRTCVALRGDTARLLDVGEAAEVETLDLTRRYGRVRGDAGSPLEGDVAAAVDRVEVLLSAELVGVAQRALDIALEHAKTRTQFGRPIGAYQAVSHRCADMLIDVESARATVHAAAWTAGNEPERLPFAASVAKVTAAGAAWRATASAMQVLGGIGFTWEHELHLYMRRAQVAQRLFGSGREHRDRIATLSGVPGPA